MEKQINPQYKKEYCYFIRMLRAAVLSLDAPLPPSCIDWQFIVFLADYNGCQCIAFDLIERLPARVRPEPEILDALKEKVGVLVTQDANQAYETERIFVCLEKEKISFLPMKGCVIKGDYSKSEYRTMTDVDVLFDSKRVESVKEIYTKNGFKFDYFDGDNQYHFYKKPYLFVEMHTSLVNHRDKHCDYYDALGDKILSENTGSFRKAMTDEDYYVFLVEHSSNHFKIGGIGLRHLLDMFVFRTKHPDMDREYIDRQLAILELELYESELWEICEKWFIKDDISDFSMVEQFVLLSSTLGRSDVCFANISLDYQKSMNSKDKRASGLRYFITSLFPGRIYMSQKYTYLDKAPFLLPFSWVQMWFTRVFIDRNVHYKSGFKNRTSRATKEDEDYISSIYNKVGLSRDDI